MGMNRPVVVSYADWVSDLARGDLGNSAAGYAQGGQVTVWSLISGKLQKHRDPGNHHLPAGGADLDPPGCDCRPACVTPADHAITITSLALVSMPEFVLGSVLIAVFFSWLGLFPPVALFPPG